MSLPLVGGARALRFVPSQRRTNQWCTLTCTIKSCCHRGPGETGLAPPNRERLVPGQSQKDITLVNCGSLSPVHSHEPASTSRASASCSRHCLCFCVLAQVCKHRLASSVLFNCLCRIDHVEVDWSCWKLPHRPTDRVRFAACTRASVLSICGPDTRRHLSTRARYLWLRAVCFWRTKRLSKSVGVKAASTSVTLSSVSPSECVRARLFTDINEGSLARISLLLNTSDRCQNVSGSSLNR